jgi:hypothetical protein
MALASENTPRGVLPPLEDVAFRLGISEDQATDALNQLLALRLIDAEDDGSFTPHQWEDWQKDRDTQPSRRGGKSRVNHANSDDSVTLITDKSRDLYIEREVEREKELEREEDKEREQEAAEPPAHPFTVLYSQKFRERTRALIDASRQGRCLSIEKEYGSERCILVAEAKGWDKHPNYYVEPLKELLNGKPGIVEPAVAAEYAGIRSKYDE